MDKLKEDQVEQLLKTIKEALETEGELIIMVRGGDHSISAVQGNPKDLGFLVAKAMRDEKAMLHIFRTAVKAVEGFDKFIKGSGLEDMLGCKNCDKKEQCDLLDDNAVLDKLKCKTESGEAIPLAKGGDA